MLLHGDVAYVHCKVYTYCTGGYSDYDFGGSRVYIVGVKNNSKDFCKTVISKYWAISCELGSKVLKECKYEIKRVSKQRRILR